MRFHRSALINLFCSVVSERNKCVLSPPTGLSYCLTVLAAKNMSLYYCSIGNPVDQNYSDDEIKCVPSDTNVKKAYWHLLMNGFDATSLRKYEKYLLKSPKDSHMKAKLLTQIAFDKSVVLPLIKLSTLRLKWTVMRSKEDSSLCHDFPDRLSYLSHHLEVKPSDLLNSLVKHSTLLTMDFARLSNKMLILKNAGVSEENLAKDLWIFNYNEKLLNNRIAKLQQAEMPIKPWLLRCHAKNFESALSKWKSAQCVLKGRNEVTFLAEKLNCSEDYVRYMMSRNTLLPSINVPKLEQIINFLFEKGYTPEEICIFPRVFCSSVKTLSRRFDDFYRLTDTMPTLSQLCVSCKNYDQCLKNM